MHSPQETIGNGRRQMQLQEVQKINYVICGARDVFKKYWNSKDAAQSDPVEGFLTAPLTATL